jgi:predicted RNA methylase
MVAGFLLGKHMAHITEVSVADMTASIVSDALPENGEPLADDIVLGIGGAARTLLQLTPRRHVNRVWDLGCGSGVQAVFAAKHANHVIATDIDQRAIDFTNQTAQLNNVEIETRLGSLFEPVQGEKFDLIISNPPFVIGGATHLTHRESPFAADALTETLLRELPNFLNDDGIAVVLATWLVTSDDWQERISEWLPDDVGVWVALRDLQDVDSYVATWMNDAGIDDRAIASQWKQQLAEWNATEVAFGWIVLHHVSDFAMMEDVRHAPALPSGQQVLTQLHRSEQSAKLSAADLLTVPFQQAPGDTWRGDIGLDPVLAAIHQGLDGRTLLGDIVADVASKMGFDEDDVLVLSLVGLKRLVALGLAFPAHG